MNRSQITVSNNIDLDQSLYRYMSLGQFLSMIENQKLYLNKVKNWEDPWEGPDDQIPFLSSDGQPIFSES